jgi:hypothetical protein
MIIKKMWERLSSRDQGRNESARIAAGKPLPHLLTHFFPITVNEQPVTHN